MTRRGVDLWPGWFYGPAGASKLCESEADVPKGWTDNQAEAIARDNSTKGKKADDGAGTAEKPKTDTAAAEKPKDDAVPAKTANPLAIARANYKEVVGKGVSPKWDVDTINAKIAEFKAAQKLDL